MKKLLVLVLVVGSFSAFAQSEKESYERCMVDTISDLTTVPQILKVVNDAIATNNQAKLVKIFQEASKLAEVACK